MLSQRRQLTYFNNTTFIFLSIFSLSETASLRNYCPIMRDFHFPLPSVVKDVTWLISLIGGFHVTSSPPCRWTKTKDLSIASFVCTLHCHLSLQRLLKPSIVWSGHCVALEILGSLRALLKSGKSLLLTNRVRGYYC